MDTRKSLSERLYNRFRQESSDKQNREDSSTVITMPLDVPPLSPIRLIGYSPQTKSRLVSPDLLEDIRQLLPPRLQLYDEWHLAYSLEQHGSSLNTLYDRVRPASRAQRRPPGYVLVIKDSRNNVFGAYVNESFRPTEQRRYTGNGECFLWKTEPIIRQTEAADVTAVGYATDSSNEIDSQPHQRTTTTLAHSPSPPAFILHDGSRFRAFPYTGENDFIIFCTQHFLSIGGGDGHYGLWIDDDLMHGITQRTTTFGNDPLTTTKFDILGVEVWRIGS